MDYVNAFQQINWYSVIVASLAAFALGGLWYSPFLFGKSWQKESNLTTEELRKSNMPLVFGLSFVLNFVSAAVLDMFLGVHATAVQGLLAGLLIGFAWIATSKGVSYLFARKTVKLFIIDASYFIIYFAIMGLILGSW